MPRNRWTSAEDERLLRQVKAFPSNLRRCFLIVSEETGRTPGAVASHWYTKVSKDPSNIIFMNISSSHINRNRKNGEGEQNTSRVWNRIMAAVRSIFPNWKAI